MTSLFQALDAPSPAGLEGLGGQWHENVRDALHEVLDGETLPITLAEGLTIGRSWALLGWAEGECSWAVRIRSGAVLSTVVGALALLDGGRLDQRDLSVVASLAHRAADLLGLPYSGILRKSIGRGAGPAWLRNASAALPPTHVQEGAGRDFSFERKPVTWDPRALEALLRSEEPEA